MSKIYAVAVGRNVGIFETWDECNTSVAGYPKAHYRSFSSKSRDLAEDFIRKNAEDNSQTPIRGNLAKNFLVYGEEDKFKKNNLSDFDERLVHMKKGNMSVFTMEEVDLLIHSMDTLGINTLKVQKSYNSVYYCMVDKVTSDMYKED